MIPKKKKGRLRELNVYGNCSGYEMSTMKNWAIMSSNWFFLTSTKDTVLCKNLIMVSIFFFLSRGKGKIYTWLAFYRSPVTAGKTSHQFPEDQRHTISASDLEILPGEFSLIIYWDTLIWTKLICNLISL